MGRCEQDLLIPKRMGTDYHDEREVEKLMVKQVLLIY